MIKKSTSLKYEPSSELLTSGTCEVYSCHRITPTSVVFVNCKSGVGPSRERVCSSVTKRERVSEKDTERGRERQRKGTCVRTGLSAKRNPYSPETVWRVCTGSPRRQLRVSMANVESGRVEPLFTGDNPVGLYPPSPVWRFKTSCCFAPIKVGRRKTAMDFSLVGEQQRWIHL